MPEEEVEVLFAIGRTERIYLHRGFQEAEVSRQHSMSRMLEAYQGTYPVLRD
jgi:hypothetical protein